MSKSAALGDLLSFSHSSSADLEAWLANADVTLAGRIRDQSVLRGESTAQFVRIAVADFTAEASEEDWASLMSAVRDAADPGAACLARMTAFRLALEVAA